MAKLQILNLAAKLLTLDPSHGTVGLLNRYILSQARYDADFDVRDRARMLSALLSGVAGLQRGDLEESAGVILRQAQVSMVLFEGKRDSPDMVRDGDTDPSSFGALAAVTGKRPINSDTYLPDWLEKGTESALRNSTEETPPVLDYVHTLGHSSLHRSVISTASLPTAPSSPARVGSPSSPVVQHESKATWSDLDKFYEDTIVANETSDETESDDDSEDSNEQDDGSDAESDGRRSHGDEEDEDT